MAQTVPTLHLRVGGTPLTAAQHDENLTILKNFSNALAAQVGSSLNVDGTLVANALTTAGITDRAVTRPKLAVDALPYFEDLADLANGNLISIDPVPDWTAFTVGTIVFVHLQAGKAGNSGNVKLEANSLTGVDGADILQYGGTQLAQGTLKENSLIMLGCISATQFLLLGSTSGGGATSGDIFNGSFDAKSGTLPDGWESVSTTGAGTGTPLLVSVDSSNDDVRHGSRAVKFTLAGGVNMPSKALWSSSASPIPCCEGEDVQASWLMKIRAGAGAGTVIPMKVICHWYQANGVAVAGTPVSDLYSKVFAKADVDWKRYASTVTPTSTARQYRLEFSCGYQDTTNHNDASIWIDDVRTSRAPYDFKSALLTWAEAATGVAHSLGVIPSRVEAYAECIDTDSGYAIGERVQLTSGWCQTSIDSGGSVGANYWALNADATLLKWGFYSVRYSGAPTIGYYAPAKSLAASFQLDGNAKWKVVFYAYL